MRKTGFRIGINHAELSNHGLATYDIEENPQDSRLISFLRDKEREVVCAGNKAKSSGGGHSG
jgi:hypothetical protein